MRNWCCFPSPKKFLTFFTFKRRAFWNLPKFTVTFSVAVAIILLPLHCQCNNSSIVTANKTEMLKKPTPANNNTIGEVTVQSNLITLTLNKLNEPRNLRKKEDSKGANSTSSTTPKSKGSTSKKPEAGQFEKRSSVQKPKKKVSTERPISSTTELLEVGGLAFDDAEADPEEEEITETQTGTSFDSLPSSEEEEEESDYVGVLPPTSSSTFPSSTSKMDEPTASLENEVEDQEGGEEEEEDPSSEENDVSQEEEAGEVEESINLETSSPSTFQAKAGLFKTSSRPSSTTPGVFVAFASTARSAADDDFPPLFKKLKSGPPTKRRTTTRRPPKKVIKPGKFKSTTTRPPTPVPELFNPHHPHGIVVFDKRRKRPKPHRTTTTTTTTPKTTTAGPEFHEDYYEYEWTSSGESLFAEEFNTTTSPTNSSASTKRPKKRIPLSKLAMAMVAQSAGFHKNGSNKVPPDFPKNPVNLLNILQAYTKQLQMQITKNGTEELVTIKPTTVQLSTQPFMVQLNSLNFASKIGISIYYSLIAIIPLVYLAFGGLGRLGFLNAIAGRRFTKKRRRKRRSLRQGYYFRDGNRFNTGLYYHNAGYHYQPAAAASHKNEVMKKVDLSEDEYAQILGRISEIILEFTLFSSDEE